MVTSFIDESRTTNDGGIGTKACVGINRWLTHMERAQMLWKECNRMDERLRSIMIKPPVISIIPAVLDRNGLARCRKRRRHKAEGTALSEANNPSGLWWTD